MIDSAVSSDGAVTLKYRTAEQNPTPLSFIYTPGTDDTGGAWLDDFRGTGGMILLLR